MARKAAQEARGWRAGQAIGSSGLIDLRRLPLEGVQPNPWNPNRQTDRQYGAEIESILLYGFIDPITVRPHPEEEGAFQILDGEHRWRALRQLQALTELPPGAHPALVAMLQEGVVPANVVPMSDRLARKFTIIANETRGKADEVKLGELLAELSKEMELGELSLALPYDLAGLGDLIAVGEFSLGHGADPTPPAAPEPRQAPPVREGDFVVFKVSMPKEALDVLMQARETIVSGHSLHDKEQIAWGQVLEMLAADYLAGNRNPGTPPAIPEKPRKKKAGKT